MNRRLATVSVISVFLLAVLLCAGAGAETGKTKVTVRVAVSPEHRTDFSAVTVPLFRFGSPDRNRENVTGERTVTVTAAEDWTSAVMLEPGWYCVDGASVVNGWKDELTGSTDIFEVKGPAMTVCVAFGGGDVPELQSGQWLFYGEAVPETPVCDPEEPPETAGTVPREETDLTAVEIFPEEETSGAVLPGPEPVPVSSGAGGKRTGDLIARIISVSVILFGGTYLLFGRKNPR